MFTGHSSGSADTGKGCSTRERERERERGREREGERDTHTPVRAVRAKTGEETRREEQHFVDGAVCAV